jgi:AraC-like DNA-binding protein/catechol 2,3-dioxygenase-like lactoylglutathione lyase family enzyme
MDIAVLPADEVPLRFSKQLLYAEGFVLVMRRGHPFVAAPTLARYCDAEHLLVSLTGDARGFIDDVLAQSGRSRRIAVTVPNFMFALAVAAETDLICAVPGRFAARARRALRPRRRQGAPRAPRVRAEHRRAARGADGHRRGVARGPSARHRPGASARAAHRDGTAHAGARRTTSLIRSADREPAVTAPDPELLRRLLRAKDRRDARSHEAWPVRRLAAVSAVSQAHFSRSFKQAFGVPPHRYLLTAPHRAGDGAAARHRAPHHRDRLRDGLGQPGTFGRIFRDVAGASPGEIPRPRPGHAAGARRRARMHRPRRAPARPHHRSFGEAAPPRAPVQTAFPKRRSHEPGVQVVGLYVRDQDEALAFYVDKLGFRVHTDVRNGDYRWLTVQAPTSRRCRSACSRAGPPVQRRGDGAGLARGRGQGRDAAAGARGRRLPGRPRPDARPRRGVHAGADRALRHPSTRAFATLPATAGR